MVDEVGEHLWCGLVSEGMGGVAGLVGDVCGGGFVKWLKLGGVGMIDRER